MRVRRLLALIGATALITAGGVAAAVPASAVDGGLAVTSSDMTDGTGLNPMFACTAGGPVPTGGQISPDLAVDFSSMATPPAAFVIVMHDEFGANAGYDPGDWVHWISYNMTPGAGVTDVPRNASQTDTLLGGTEGLNTWNEAGYRGPCPPPGGTHNYYFTVYALDAAIAPANQSAPAILAAMQGHILDQGDLQVTFTNTEVNTTEALVELEFAGPSQATEGDGLVTTPLLLVNGVVAGAASATLLIDSSACGHLGATDGSDYTYSGGSSTINVPIPAGTYDGTAGTAITVPGLVSLVDDALAEPVECLAIQLVAVTGAGVAIGDAGHSGPTAPGSEPGQAVTMWTLEITDDDLGGGGLVPIIEFGAASASGDEATGGSLPVLLVDGVVVTPFDVTLTVTGTATDGTDFTAPVTVTIPAGLYLGTGPGVPIPGFTVNDDTVVEPDETVIFTLSADPAVALVGDANFDTVTQGTTTFTILDDDVAAPAVPTIEFASATGSSAEGAGGQLPLLLISGTLAEPVAVTVTVTGGTANGSDYTAPTLVTIPAGTYDGTAATGIAIPGFTITDDDVVEPDETAAFALSTANAQLLVVGDANGNGITVAALTFTITNDDAAPSPSPSGSSSSSGSGSLANTGGDLGSSLLVGLGLLLVGSLAVIRRARKA